MDIGSGRQTSFCFFHSGHCAWASEVPSHPASASAATSHVPTQPLPLHRRPSCVRDPSPLPICPPTSRPPARFLSLDTPQHGSAVAPSSPDQPGSPTSAKPSRGPVPPLPSKRGDLTLSQVPGCPVSRYRFSFLPPAASSPPAGVGEEGTEKTAAPGVGEGACVCCLHCGVRLDSCRWQERRARKAFIYISGGGGWGWRKNHLDFFARWSIRDIWPLKRVTSQQRSWRLWQIKYKLSVLAAT